MPYNIIRGNLSSASADAIIYADTPQPFTLFAFNADLILGKGKELKKTREALNPIIIGEAKITTASELDAKYIVHTSAPVWHRGLYHEERLLRSCYAKSFQLAYDHQCESVALPIIAYDGLGYPKKMAEQIAFDCIADFLRTHDAMISIVVPEKTVLMRTMKPYSDVRKYIAAHYTEGACEEQSTDSAEKIQAFSETLSHWILRKNMAEQEVRHNANMSVKVFRDILTGKAQSLSKNHAIALGIGLRLSLDEMKEFLKTAGFELTKNSEFDLIIEHYILKNNYDLFEINPMLFRFEQPLVGA